MSASICVGSTFKPFFVMVTPCYVYSGQEVRLWEVGSSLCGLADCGRMMAQSEEIGASFWGILVSCLPRSIFLFYVPTQLPNAISDLADCA
jgi:hypothetical protein